MTKEQVKHWYAGLAFQSMIADSAMHNCDEDVAAQAREEWGRLLATARRLVEERDKWRGAALKLKNASINREGTSYVEPCVRDALTAILDLELAEWNEESK
jgi:hypothetical protein